MAFAQLGLSEPLLKAVADKGYKTPSPIQQQAIPVVLSGRDILAAAQTGTGKTAGFTLPILHRLADGERVRANGVRCLILTPTRELAAQVEENVRDYSRYLNLRSTVVFGGVSINPQMQKLRRGVDILVATPGRLLDLYQQNAIKFHQLEVLVLDEADRMLDMGFIHDIKRIAKLIPSKRQTLLFSATFSDPIRQLAERFTQQPEEISVTPANSTVEVIEQRVVPLDKSRKVAALIALIKQKQWQQTLVFSRTKHGANRIATKLASAGIPAAAIHGNKSQGARTKALAEFKSNKIKVLVATDIAARGIDIQQLPQVVNLDLPNQAADYVHRIGRTGRAGAAGLAVSLVSADEAILLRDIERLTQQSIPREVLAGFEPQQPIPTGNIPKTTQKKASDDRPAKPRRRRRPNRSGAANNSASQAAKSGRRQSSSAQRQSA